MNKVPESIDADRTALFCTQVEITGLRYVGACRVIDIDRWSVKTKSEKRGNHKTSWFLQRVSCLLNSHQIFDKAPAVFFLSDCQHVTATIDSSKNHIG